SRTHAGTEMCLRSTGAQTMRHAGFVMIGSATTAPVAQLHVNQPTSANEIERWETGSTGSPVPRRTIFQKRATAAASATTNIDLNVTTAAPTDAPCPSGTICLGETNVVCHCTSGSACTADGGAALETKWLIKNNAGT